MKSARVCQPPWDEACGKPATVRCTERDVCSPLQWFACADPEHQGEALTESMEDYDARVWVDRVLRGELPWPY
jgi:hypothetical protein